MGEPRLASPRLVSTAGGGRGKGGRGEALSNPTTSSEMVPSGGRGRLEGFLGSPSPTGPTRDGERKPSGESAPWDVSSAGRDLTDDVALLLGAPFHDVGRNALRTVLNVRHVHASSGLCSVLYNTVPPYGLMEGKLYVPRASPQAAPSTATAASVAVAAVDVVVVGSPPPRAPCPVSHAPCFIRNFVI